MFGSIFLIMSNILQDFNLMGVLIFTGLGLVIPYIINVRNYD
jgi:hypothetical protein